MLRTLSPVLAFFLLAGAAPVAAESSSDEEVPRQRLSLPGYEVSIEVPAEWEVEPQLGGSSGLRPHESSPFVSRFWTQAYSQETGQWCLLSAYSRLGCAVPVDLEAELAGLDPEWREYAAGTVAHVVDDSLEDATCMRHLVTDGVDLYEVHCCGSETPADEWRSIVETLELPAETRPARVAATDRSLVDDAAVTWDLWGNVHGPTFEGGLSGVGGGSARTALERIWDPPVQALVDEIALPADRIAITEHVWSDDDGNALLVIDGVQAPGAAAGAARAGLLAWAETEWAETFGSAPSAEAANTGDMDALRLTAPGVEGVEYLVAEGDSAVKAWGASDEIVLSFLKALPCDHLDTWQLLSDVLKAGRPDG